RDKPAEYARFALTLDAVLAIAVAAAIGTIRRADVARAAAVVLVASTAYAGFWYVRNFVAGASDRSTRHATAEALATFQRPDRVLAVWAEPAPYCLPPVDLFDWRIVLLPR